jgi:hypothetical protein
MSSRKKTASCPCCGRPLLKGKRALVQGVFRRVCLICSAKAVRVCTVVGKIKCTSTKCDGAASVCVTCATSAVTDALANPLGPIADALRAMIRGLSVVENRESEHAEEYLAGKIEGLESALSLVQGRLS